MFKVKILTDEKTDRWDKFVSSHEQGSIYHTSLWANVIERCYGHNAVRLVIEDAQNNILAGMPVYIIKSKVLGNKMSTVPCAQCCNPLVTSGIQYDYLIESILQLIKAHKVSYYELKTNDNFAFANCNTGRLVSNYSLYQLDLGRPLKTIEKTFHKSCIQRPIYKSLKSGLQLKVAESEGDVRDFYRLYVRMRKSHGLLSQPYRFFSCMWDILSNNDCIELLHAEYEGRVISSALLLKFKDTVIYEYGATDSRMTHLHPSHYLLWMAIQRAHSQGYKFFDFGRTSNDNIDLTVFKSRWGTQRKELSYYYFPDIRGIALFRQKSLANRLMHQFVANAPDAICAWMGQQLYRNLL